MRRSFVLFAQNHSLLKTHCTNTFKNHFRNYKNMAQPTPELVSVLSSEKASKLDVELMSTLGYTLEQLMELAGLSCSQAIFKSFQPQFHKKVLVVVGPGNNGGDGLVCARHLKLFGYDPVVHIIKLKETEFFHNLVKQLNLFEIPIVQSIDWNLSYHLVIDAIFGFSFKLPVRSPYDTILEDIMKYKKSHSDCKIVCIDTPTGWDVNKGPVNENSLNPDMLVSLTCPKPCSEKLSPDAVHYLGGRFIPEKLAVAYQFKVPEFENDDQCVRLQ